LWQPVEVNPRQQIRLGNFWFHRSLQNEKSLASQKEKVTHDLTDRKVMSSAVTSRRHALGAWGRR
jgi:hypothetical protein